MVKDFHTHTHTHAFVVKYASTCVLTTYLCTHTVYEYVCLLVIAFAIILRYPVAQSSNGNVCSPCNLGQRVKCACSNQLFKMHLQAGIYVSLDICRYVHRCVVERWCLSEENVVDSCSALRLCYAFVQVNELIITFC